MSILFHNCLPDNFASTATGNKKRRNGNIVLVIILDGCKEKSKQCMCANS